MRAPDVPIARINGSGYGMDAAVGRTAWYVIYEGPQSLFVDDDGRAFCMPQGCALMLHWCESRPTWWVGNFELRRRESLRQTIVENLRERMHELRAAAA